METTQPLRFAGSALLALQLVTVSALGASETSRASDVSTMAEAETATKTVTLRVHGMMKSRSGAT